MSLPKTDTSKPANKNDLNSVRSIVDMLFNGVGDGPGFKEATRDFHEFDKNKDGKLTPDDDKVTPSQVSIAQCSNITMKTAEAGIKDALRQFVGSFDTVKDGKLDTTEFVALQKALVKIGKEMGNQHVKFFTITKALQPLSTEAAAKSECAGTINTDNIITAYEDVFSKALPAGSKPIKVDRQKLR